MRISAGDTSNWLPFVVVLIVSLIVYTVTLAPGITWANHSSDGGELITAAVTLGVPHPPGYPTYILLANLATRVPIGDISWRFNLFSAICTALAASFVTVTAGILVPKTTGASLKRLVVQVSAGLSFAFMPLVWGQATVTEVYALNIAVVAALLLSLFSRRAGWQIGLLLGLAITTHLTSLLLAPLVVGMLSRNQGRSFAIGILAGLSPFLLLPLFGRGDSPLIWGNPTNVSGWWWMVSGRLYQPNVLAVPPERWLTHLFAGQSTTLRRLAYAGPLLIAAMLFVLRPQNRKRYLLMLLTVALFAFYAASYNTVDAALFFMPGLLILSLILAEGLFMLGWAALLLPAALLVLNFRVQDLHRDLDVARNAAGLLEAAPNNAILLSPGDPTIFTLWYYQHVVGTRPDIVLVDENLFAFDWYRKQLKTHYDELDYLEVDDLPGFMQHNSGRPLCEVNLSTQPYLACATP